MEKSPNKKVEEITKNEKVINKNKNEEQPLKKIEKKKEIDPNQLKVKKNLTLLKRKKKQKL